MKRTAALFLSLSALLSSIAGAHASEEIFCTLSHSTTDIERYTIPDENKTWSMVHNEIDDLKKDKARAESEGSIADAALIQAEIVQKESLLATKRNYDAEMATLRYEISELKKQKSSVHSDALSIYNADGFAQADLFCGGLIESPFTCAAEEAVDADIADKTNQISTIKKARNQETKWAQRRQQQTNAARAKNMYEMTASDTIKGNGALNKPGSVGLFEMVTMGLNTDMDGIAGDLSMIKQVYYTCETKTKTPKERFNVSGVPMFVADKGDTEVDVYFCMESFLQRGSCKGVDELTEPDSGWQAETIVKNSSIWKKFYDDKIWLKSTCIDNNLPSEECTLSVKLKEETDFNAGNFSQKTTNLLVQNPSFNRVLNTAISDDFTQASSKAKTSYYDANNCSFRAVDVGTDEYSNLSESEVIDCQKPILDDNGRVQTANDGKVLTEDYSMTVNLLECTTEEVCEKKVEEEINYTEGCVSPFPVTEVTRVTDVPDGNCALKFDKEAYTCAGERVMDTRTCTITRNQNIEQCEPEAVITYNENPVPAFKGRFHEDGDIDNPWELWEKNDENNLNRAVQWSYSGRGYVTVNMINREQDMGKYVVFKVTTYHNHGKHTQSGLSGWSQRPWGHSDGRYQYAGDAAHGNLVNWFVINLEDESGGEISPPTWDGDYFGRVTEVSWRNAGVVEFGAYGHSMNWETCGPFGCCCYADEVPYFGSISASPAFLGGDWCSPVEASKLNEGAGTWKLEAPYGHCNVWFNHGAAPQPSGQLIDPVCPSGSSWLARDEGSYTTSSCDDDGWCSYDTVSWNKAEACLSNTFSEMQGEVAGTQYTYFDLDTVECSSIPSYQYSANPSEIRTYKYQESNGVCRRYNHILKSYTTWDEDGAGETEWKNECRLPGQSGYQPICGSSEVQPTNKCVAVGPTTKEYTMTFMGTVGVHASLFSDSYYRSRPQLSTGPDDATGLTLDYLNNYSVSRAVVAELPVEECAAYEQAVQDLDDCLNPPPPAEGEEAPDTSLCKFVDYWDKPYHVKSLDGEWQQVDAHGNDHRLQFWLSQGMVEPVERQRIVGDWSMGVQIPHLEVTKSIAALPGECNVLDSYRDEDAIAAGK